MRNMKIRVMTGVFLAALTLLLIFPGAAVSGQRLAVKVKIANMRSGPGKQFPDMWQVEKYHPVVVVGEKGDWCKIKDFENDMAWIHKSLLEKISTVITIKNKCNVRSKASKSGQVLFTVEKGIPFKVIDKKGSWIKIKHADGDVGWIYKTLVW